MTGDEPAHYMYFDIKSLLIYIHVSAKHNAGLKELNPNLRPCDGKVVAIKIWPIGTEPAHRKSYPDPNVRKQYHQVPNNEFQHAGTNKVTTVLLICT